MPHDWHSRTGSRIVRKGLLTQETNSNAILIMT